MNDRKNRKITYIAGSMGSGGAERVISILANSYAKDGWEVDIIMLLNNICYYSLHENVKLIPMCNTTKARVLFFPVWIRSLRNYFIQNDPDIIVSFIARINLITIIASLGLNKRIIISERSNPKKDGRSIIIKFMTMVLYPLADKIIFQTRAAQLNFSSRIQKKSQIIPNPIVVESIAKENIDSIIVSVGRLRPEKNHRMLIEAFHKIKKDFPNYKLFIYGEGPLRIILNSQIKKLELEDSVFLPGNVTNIHERISNSEIFVLPSNHEGLSNALLEAMLMGLPCISTNYEGVSEIIEDGQNGIITPIDDVDSMYKSIRALIEDKKKARYLGKEANKSVQKMSIDYILPIWRNAINFKE